MTIGSNKGPGLVARHFSALKYIFQVVLPCVLRTGRRPVIFSRLIGMGDIICTIPAVRELMKRHRGARFIYNCHRDFAAIPQLARVADEVTSLESIGVVGHWYRFLLGGFYHFAHGDDLPGKVAQEPMVAEFCRQFNVPVTEEHPVFDLPPELLQRVKNILRGKNLDLDNLVVIHPGPSWTVKEWPLANWKQLVSGLREQGHTSIARLGAGRYLTSGAVATEDIPGTVSLVDELSLAECVAVISLAKLFIGIDSGLLHIAASTRTSAVGLWGSTLPQFFYAADVRKNFVVADVECAGCFHRPPRAHWFTNCPHEIKCMKSVEPAKVLQVCLAELQPSPAVQTNP